MVNNFGNMTSYFLWNCIIKTRQPFNNCNLIIISRGSWHCLHWWNIWCLQCGSSRLLWGWTYTVCHWWSQSSSRHGKEAWKRRVYWFYYAISEVKWSLEFGVFTICVPVISNTLDITMAFIKINLKDQEDWQSQARATL